MTIEISREVAEGIRFSVLSGSPSGNGEAIVIPTLHIEKFTAEELYEIMLSLLPLARLASMEDFADWLIKNCNGKPIPPFVMESQGDELNQLFAYRGQSGIIDEAIALLEMTQQRTKNRVAGKAKRDYVAQNYNELFVAIGRRDGFYCQHCQAHYDLTIDHIVAIINGGTNDLENLQLLCGSCNSRKSDK